MASTLHLPMWLRIGDNPEQQVGHVDIDLSSRTTEADDGTRRGEIVMTRPPAWEIKRRLAAELHAMADHLDHEADHEEEVSRAAPRTG